MAPWRLAGLAALVSLLGIHGSVNGSVARTSEFSAVTGYSITWQEYSDLACTRPVGPPTTGTFPLGACGVVPLSDLNPSWRLTSFSVDACDAAPGGEATVHEQLFSDDACTMLYRNQTLSKEGQTCRRVGQG